MKDYYYMNGSDRIGPLSLDELKKEELKSTTLVWFEGLEKWTNASQLPELKTILRQSPPPIPTRVAFREQESVSIDDYSIDELFPDEADSGQSMFSNVFSFSGRIRRTEYGFSFILFVVGVSFTNAIIADAPIIGLALIPLYWFLWAQGAKRCHDRGNSGWFQLIPFYGFWMLFAEGESGRNAYGQNPKA